MDFHSFHQQWRKNSGNEYYSQRDLMMLNITALTGEFLDQAIVDLGCGSGANFRYLYRYVAPNQMWREFDCDDEALSQAAA